jgi:glycosyltransferase involved in cell wall biosynthesis
MVLLPAAIVRRYRGDRFGLAGWAVSLVSLVALGRTPDLGITFANSWTVWDGVLAAGLLLAVALYLGFPGETVLEGGDMAVYANHAISIARRGRLDLPYPWAGADPALDEALTGHTAHKSPFYRNHVFLGFQKDGHRVTAEFGHLWPVWLAQAFATAGPAGLFRLNALFALLAAGVFHGLCLTVVPAPVAAAFTVFLMLNPGQVWIVRTTLSEVFAQLTCCAGVLMWTHALRTDTCAPALWAGAVLSLAALVRCDNFLFLALSFCAHSCQSLLVAPSGHLDRVWFAFYETAVPGFLLAAGYYLGFSRPYFCKQFFYLRLIGIGTALALASLLTVRWLVGAGALATPAAGAVADLAGVLAILAACYAYWVRPAIVHYRIEWPDYPLHGKPYRAEYSLRDLGRYLSPIVLGAAVLGGWLALREAASPASPWLLPWLVAITAYAGLYLYDPYDDPGHIFRIRRYVPVVIPGFLFLAGFAGARGLDAIPREWRGGILTALTACLVGLAVRRGGPFWFRSEGAGTWSQLRSLAELVPPDALVFAAGRPEWMTPLHVAFDHRVVPLDLDQDAGWEILALAAADAARRGQPVYLMTDNGHVYARRPRELGRVVLSRRFLERTDYPVPRRFVVDQMTVALVALTDTVTLPDPLACTLGTSKVWGVEESGFHGEWDGGECLDNRRRWTNGHARLVVPIPPGAWPGRLLISLASASPTGGPLRVLVNGHEVRSGPHAGAGGQFEILSLRGVPPDRRLVLELISDCFVPREVIDGSTDDRPLGVHVRALRLLPDETRARHLPDREPCQPGSVAVGHDRSRRNRWDIGQDASPAPRREPGRMVPSSERRAPRRSHRPKPTVAFFSPLPPARSGVSDYSAALLGELRKHYTLDLFHDRDYVPELPFEAREFRCYDYRLFDRVAAARDYHAIVYQMGNSPFHSYMLDPLTRHPGLVTLHDVYLPGFHMQYGESRGLGPMYFAEELRRWYPEDWEAIEDTLATWPVGWDLVRECVRKGWHLNRRILEAAQVMVVHSPWCASEAQKRTPRHDRKVAVIPHGTDPRPTSPAEKVAARFRFGLPRDVLIFGSFGFMNAEKMNVQALRAFAEVTKHVAPSLFVFVGEEEDGGEARRVADSLQLGDRVRIFGHQPAEVFEALVSVTDIGVNLRLPPTNGETSGALLKLLAVGVPTIVTDVATFTDFPASVVRKFSWESEGPRGLQRAMSDLATLPEFRGILGRAALDHVRSFHQWSRVGELYVEAVERCHRARGESRPGERNGHPLGICTTSTR